MSKERLEELKEVSCFACHVEILWKDPMCIHNNKSYCRNCYLQVLRKQNQRYKQALDFYAEKQAYYYTSEHQSEVMEDFGYTARQALAGDNYKNERKS